MGLNLSLPWGRAFSRKLWAVLCLAGLGNALSVGVLGQTAPAQVERALALYDELRAAPGDVERLALHGALERGFEEAFASGTGLDVAWEALQGRMGWAQVGTGDQALRVITWNVELEDRTQRYGGFVVQADAKSPMGYRAHPLRHLPRSDVREVGKRFAADAWPGAVYYQAVLTYERRAPVYTLLGWDGADGLTTRKVVEVLELQGGQLRVGAPRIEARGATQRRLVLEYGDVLSVLLRHDGERIVMDHLSPRSADVKGVAALYGPDMTYDALEWDGKRWNLRENVDVRDPNLQVTFPDPKAPRGRRPPR